ncbi:MAG TPA: hypothetical protein VMU84_08155 [Thermoanaerobaculia bacterium]|nr:hypothetical protein [Thermoanaerobaculia bacterium]
MKPLALLLLVASIASADQPLGPIGLTLGPDVVAGAPLPGGTPRHQRLGGVARVGDEVVIVFEDERTNHYPGSIFSARVGRNGDRPDANGTAVAVNGGWAPRIAVRGSSPAVLWETPSYRLHLSLDGLVRDIGSGSNGYPLIASTGSTFLVTYGGAYLYGTLLDAQGTPVTTKILDIGYATNITASENGYLITAVAPNGGYLILLDKNANATGAAKLNTFNFPGVAAHGDHFVVAVPHGSVETMTLRDNAVDKITPIFKADFGAREAALASNGDELLLVTSVYAPVAGCTNSSDLWGMRLDGNGAAIGNAFPIATGGCTNEDPKVAWNGSAYIVAWDATTPASPDVETVRYALVARDGSVFPPAMVSGAQLTSAPGTMLHVHGAINDTARFAIWNETGAINRTRYLLGNRAGELATGDVVVHDAIAGDRFAVAWSRGTTTRLTLLGTDGTRSDVDLPVGEVVRGGVAFDGVRYLVATAGASGTIATRVSVDGVLIDKHVLDTAPASAIATTFVNNRFVVAAALANNDFLAYTIDGDISTILAQSAVRASTRPFRPVDHLAIANDGVDAYLVSNTYGIARLSSQTAEIVWKTIDWGPSFFDYGEPSVARINNREFLAVWGHTFATRFNVNGAKEETKDFPALIDAVVVQKPDGAELLQQRTVADPPSNGIPFYVFRDVIP